MKSENEIDNQTIEYIPLKVTSGILMHIGSGIYNSIAGALKELVSNSFDADARIVTISLDYPFFNLIKVVDDGNGMSSTIWRQAMQNIGSSLKGTIEPSRITLKYKRPVIGHLGIGLMALSQICSKATIESQKYGSKTKFIAELDFSQFKEQESRQLDLAKLEVLRDTHGGIKEMHSRLNNKPIENDERIQIEENINLAKAANKRIEEKAGEDSAGEHLGYCLMYPDLPAIEGEHGTNITLSEIDKGVNNILNDFERPVDIFPKRLMDLDNKWKLYRQEINRLSWEEIIRGLNQKGNQMTYQL